jgi:murein DD-endopeptidase MepM/ murein hydrolase activator NlpD
MSETSANESVDSSKIYKNSIIENSGILKEDLKKDEVSIWCAKDSELGSDSLNRKIIRQQAKHHIDEMIFTKIEELNTKETGDIDGVLEKISAERQEKRDRLKTDVLSGNKRKRKRYSSDGQLDDRLDNYIDQTLCNIAKGWQLIDKRIGTLARPVVLAARKKEEKLSVQMGNAMDSFDIFLDKLFVKGIKTIDAACEAGNKFNAWCRKHKLKFIGAIAAVTVISAVSTLVADHFTAYEYMYNGKVLGIVKDQDCVYNTIDLIGDKLCCEYGAEIMIDKEQDISFRKISSAGKQLDRNDDVLDRFTYMRGMNAVGYAIEVDGTKKAIVYSKECADKLLNAIKSKYLTENASITYESVGFAENVDIVEISTKLGNIQREEDVLEYMLTGAVEIKTYSVESGDTFGQIAKDIGIDIDELMATNPDVDPARLQIGQELVLNRVCPVITVQTTEIAEYIEPIDYDIDYEETSTLYKGEQTVKSTGVKGERQVVAQIIRNNGEEVDRNEISSDIISEPQNQVVLKGTKDPPPLIGTGRLIYPVRGTLTSRFGTRWGRMHNGIDLANPVGTKIRAADGGVVISAGWEGALGYCVRIDHGQNRTTVYGHCSKLLVKKGDRVYQDQHIANVGNTGRSTGPHLHFEVHINGVPKNPLNYLN